MLERFHNTNSHYIQQSIRFAIVLLEISLSEGVLKTSAVKISVFFTNDFFSDFQSLYIEVELWEGFLLKLKLKLLQGLLQH